MVQLIAKNNVKYYNNKDVEEFIFKNFSNKLYYGKC